MAHLSITISAAIFLYLAEGMLVVQAAEWPAAPPPTKILVQAPAPMPGPLMPAPPPKMPAPAPRDDEIIRRLQEPLMPGMPWPPPSGAMPPPGPILDMAQCRTLSNRFFDLSKRLQSRYAAQLISCINRAASP